MQAEEAVQIDSRVLAAIRRGDRDSRAHFVIALFAERHHHVESIHRATLKDGDQNLLAASSRLRRIHRAPEPGRRRPHAKNRQRRTLQEPTSSTHNAFPTTYDLQPTT